MLKKLDLILELKYTNSIFNHIPNLIFGIEKLDFLKLCLHVRQNFAFNNEN